MTPFPSPTPLKDFITCTARHEYQFLPQFFKNIAPSRILLKIGCPLQPRCDVTLIFNDFRNQNVVQHLYLTIFALKMWSYTHIFTITISGLNMQLNGQKQFKISC